MNSHKKRRTGGDTWSRRTLPTLCGDLQAHGGEKDDAHHQHEAEHEAKALENLEIGVVRPFPDTLDTDRAIPIQREDVAKRAIAEAEQGSIENRAQCDPIDG